LLLKAGHSLAHGAAQALGRQAHSQQLAHQLTRIVLHLQGDFREPLQGVLRRFGLSRTQIQSGGLGLQVEEPQVLGQTVVQLLRQ